MGLLLLLLLLVLTENMDGGSILGSRRKKGDETSEFRAAAMGSLVSRSISSDRKRFLGWTFRGLRVVRMLKGENDIDSE